MQQQHATPTRPYNNMWQHHATATITQQFATTMCNHRFNNNAQQQDATTPACNHNVQQHAHATTNMQQCHVTRNAQQ
eukprot:11226622-Lingulodinium_polyedra.AAC.1